MIIDVGKSQGLKESQQAEDAGKVSIQVSKVRKSQGPCLKAAWLEEFLLTQGRLCSTQGFWLIGGSHTLEREICFIQFTYLGVNVPTCPHRNTQNVYAPQISGYPITQSMCRINHHIMQDEAFPP